MGLISTNRAEWNVLDYACATAGLILVPIYDTQSLGEITIVCEDAQIKTIFSALDKLERIKHVKFD